MIPLKKPPPAQIKKKVLVIDDGITMRMYYRDVLEKAGFAVEEAANGVEGLEKVLGARYDLIIVDINMPKMNGYEFVCQLRKDPASVAVPVMTISTEDKEQDKVKAYEVRREFLHGQAGSPRGIRTSRQALYEAAVMNPLLARFIPEAQELIQQSATGILKLEKDPENEVAINEVFRAVHTLKGASGLFDALPLTNFVHAGEDVLSAVRSGAMKLTADIADHILDMLDQVGVWLGDMEKEEALPPSSAEISHRLASALRVFLPQLANDALERAKDRAQPEDALAGSMCCLKQPDFAHLLLPLRQSSQSLSPLSNTAPVKSCFYSGEDPVNLVTQFRSLARFRFRCVHRGPRSTISILIAAISSSGL